MNFCAGCGSPNLDTDADCRVCGRSLSEEAAPVPVATTATVLTAADNLAATRELTAPPAYAATTAVAEPSIGPGGWPSPRGATADVDRPAHTPSVAHAIPSIGTATPNGFESAAPRRPEPTERPDAGLPSFMRPAARAATASAANESASLISEHDLPDWIRQIAADDARKLAETRAQEEAASTVSSSSMPSHFGRRALPGETLTSGPASSSWLSRKDAVAGAAGSAWEVTSAPPPSRPVGVAADLPAQPAAQAHLAVDVAVTEAVAAPARRRRRGAVDDASAVVPALPKESRTPPLQGLTGGDPKRLYLILAIAVALLLALATLIL